MNYCFANTFQIQLLTLLNKHMCSRSPCEQKQSLPDTRRRRIVFHLPETLVHDHRRQVSPWPKEPVEQEWVACANQQLCLRTHKLFTNCWQTTYTTANICPTASPTRPKLTGAQLKLVPSKESGMRARTQTPADGHGSRPQEASESKTNRADWAKIDSTCQPAAAPANSQTVHKLSTNCPQTVHNTAHICLAASPTNRKLVGAQLKLVPSKGRTVAKVKFLEVLVLRFLDTCYVFLPKFQDFDNFYQKWQNCDRLLTETYLSEDDCKSQISWCVGATFSWHMLSVFA